MVVTLIPADPKKRKGGTVYTKRIKKDQKSIEFTKYCPVNNEHIKWKVKPVKKGGSKKYK